MVITGGKKKTNLIKHIRIIMPWWLEIHSAMPFAEAQHSTAYMRTSTHLFPPFLRMREVNVRGESLAFFYRFPTSFPLSYTPTIPPTIPSTIPPLLLGGCCWLVFIFFEPF